MPEEIQIQDESNDRKYFTIVPNYVLNHSTDTDQALYLQIKRIAGDKDTCSASLDYFCRQLDAAKNTVKKSLKYLIKNKWIKEIEPQTIETTGGQQKVRSFKINDLWKLNVDYYQKGGQNNTHLEQRGVKIDPKGGQNRPHSNNSKERISKDMPKTLVFGDPLINFYMVHLLKWTGLATLDGTIKENRQYSYLLIKFKIKKELQAGKKELTDENIKGAFVYMLNHANEFHRKNMTSFKYLYKNFNKILT